MAILLDAEVNYWPEEMHSSPSLEAYEFTIEKFHCVSNADSSSLICKHESFSDMLLWLKCVAVNPCNLEASSEKGPQLQNRVLKARKVLFLSHTALPWKKRKLGQLLREKTTATLDLSPAEPNKRGVTRLSRVQYSSASSFSCLISNTDSIESSEQIHQYPPSSVKSLKFGDNLSRKRVPNAPSFHADPLDWSSPSSKEVEFFLDSDDSISGSNSLGPTKSLPHNPHGSVKLQKNSDDSVNSSHVLAPSEPRQDQTPRRSVRLLNFIGDYLPRMAIPVGPRFQADIPDWTGPSNMKNSSRWLGTQIWPIEGRNTATSLKVIGKGRPNSCACDHPGSTKCIKHHIIEKRLRLRSELGPAFFSWGFHEMGGEVSKTWTLMEQKNFKILVKMNSASKNKSFWKLAVKCFPHRCRKSIVNYYFNVHVLGRMSRQTRLASAVVDSDDDNEVEERSRDLKSRYLTSSGLTQF